MNRLAMEIGFGVYAFILTAALIVAAVEALAR
jgi:hypothetical protein